MDQNTSQLTCDAILFDLDGVLIDSTRCIVRHWQEWAEQHDLDLSEILRVAHGIRTIETMRHIAPHLDVESEAAQFTAHEVADTDGVVAIAGARRVLDAMPEGAWAIVTSGSSALAKARLRHAGLPIPSILVTADDVTRGKPDPEPYLIGAQRLGVAVERCVVIEDAPAGVESAHKAGMRVIGIQATHTCEALLEKGADVVIEQLTQLHIRETVQKNHLVIHVS
jgi:sugar-phosphatase